MKKRIFGILLMGAMVVASMSMFTSCKDYDDDINSVKNDVTALRTELASLKTTLANDLSTAKSQLQTAIDAKASAADLTALAGRVATLETKIQAIDNCASKSDVTTLATTLATLTGDVTALQNALAAKANSTDLEKYALDANLQAAIANIELQQQAIATLQTKVQELQTALAAKGNVEAVTALQNSLNTLTTQLGEEKTKLATATSNISSLQTSMNNLSTDVEKVLADINVLTVLVNKNLTSLVYKPYLYDGGIETAELVAFINPYAYTIKKAGKNNESWERKRLSAVSLYPTLDLEYHFNPSTADLDGFKASFFNNVSTTRGVNDIIKPVSDEISNENKTSEAGVLALKAANNSQIFDAVYKNYNNKTALFIALQAAKADTVVNSDYVRIKAKKLYELFLADNTIGKTKCANVAGDYDLVQYVAEGIALTAAQSHKIKYDTTNVDLKQYIETHYNDGGHALVSKKVLEELGLSYKFKTISYVRNADADETDESIHIKVTEDGLATPQEVDNTGKVVGDNKKRGAIGREPVVRVTLEDANGTIYAIGYIKLVISEDVDRPAVNAGVTFNGTIYANCDNPYLSLTWAQVESDILNAVNFTHNELQARVAGADGSTVWAGDQYIKQADGTYITAKAHDEKIAAMVTAEWSKGTETYDTPAWYINELICKEYYAQGGTGSIYVNFGASDIELVDGVTVVKNQPTIRWWSHGWGNVYVKKYTGDMRTSLFRWSLDNETAWAMNRYNMVSNGQNTTALTTAILLPGNPDLYVDLTIPAGSIKFATISVAADATLNKFWYDADATVKAKGAERELRASVITPTKAGANGDTPLEEDDFKFNILSTFVGGKLNVSSGDKFSSFADVAIGKFMFVAPTGAATDANLNGGVSGHKDYKDALVWTVKGVSGSTYTLAVTDDYGDLTNNGHGTQIRIVKVVDAYRNYVDASGVKTVSGVKTYGVYDIAVAPVVAKLSGTNNALAEYGTNFRAQDILNYKSHSDLKADETFAAYVTIDLEQTGPACYTPQLGGSTMFAIRFQRPIDATSGVAQEATDAKDGFQTVQMFNAADPTKNMLQLADWRGTGYNFFNPATNVGYLKYYGVNLKLVMDEARSDLSQAQGATVSDPSTLATLKTQLGDMFVTTKAQVEAKIAANKPYFYLATQYTVNRIKDKETKDKDGKITAVSYKWADFANSVASSAKIEYVPEVKYELNAAKTALTSDGNDAYFKNAPVITYRNNTTNVDNFYIYVPVDVVYTFGSTSYYTQRVYGKILVKKTEGSARAK